MLKDKRTKNLETRFLGARYKIPVLSHDYHCQHLILIGNINTRGTRICQFHKPNKICLGRAAHSVADVTWTCISTIDCINIKVFIKFDNNIFKEQFYEKYGIIQ